MKFIPDALAGLAVGLFLAGLLLFAVGEPLIAGLCMLLVSMTIYYREKND